MKTKEKILFSITLILIVVLAFGCSVLSKPPKAIEDAARGFIDKQIASQNEPGVEKHGLRIIDSKITKLEKLAVFDDILDYPIEVWNLEFKLKPNENTEYAIKRGTIIENGWITEDNGMGKTCLIFKIDGDNTSILNGRQAEDFNFDSLSKLEIRVRGILISAGSMPNGSYEGNHIIVKFDGIKDGHIELFLSQPVIQGPEGIWAVEKWKDEDGFINNVYPGIDARRTDISINEKYEELQDEFSSGKDLSLGDPIDVAMSFIKYKLRQVYSSQIQVERTDLQVIDPATMEDFID